MRHEDDRRYWPLMKVTHANHNCGPAASTMVETPAPVIFALLQQDLALIYALCPAFAYRSNPANGKKGTFVDSQFMTLGSPSNSICQKDYALHIRIHALWFLPSQMPLLLGLWPHLAQLHQSSNRLAHHLIFL